MPASTTEGDGKPKKHGVEKAEFRSIDLESLNRFATYVSELRHVDGPVPMSMRAFMKGQGGSHLVLTTDIDHVENFAKQLLVARAILNEDKTQTGNYTESFQTVHTKGVKSKRIPGALTRNGHAWERLSLHIEDLFKLMIAGGEDADFLIRAIEKQNEALVEAKRAIEHFKQK